jgi:hypothetical protein
MDQTTNRKEEYAKAVCYFLAELLRNHRVALPRAAEISEKVVANINLIDTELQFLEFIRELSRDFDELVSFSARIDMHMKVGEREKLDTQVREFVIFSLDKDLELAYGVLNEAVQPGACHEVICGKFPIFKQFIESRTWTT